MITEFKTGGLTGSPTSKSSGDGIVKLILIVAVLYAGYRFVVKPMLDAKNTNETNLADD